MTRRFLAAIAMVAMVIPALGSAQNAGDTASQDTPATPTAAAKKVRRSPTPGVTRYTMTAGDLTGDGVAESIVYDSDSEGIRITNYAGKTPVQAMSIYVDDVPLQMAVADLEGDGRAELIVGAGLGGYNPKDGPQTDVSIRVYTPAAKGDWKPVEIYRTATERPEVTSLEVKDLDGDGRAEILFAYFASKYISELRVARREGTAWTISELPSVRMGAAVDAGDVLQNGRPMAVVGRLYGDPADAADKTPVGGAFVIDGDKRIELPVTRGVAAIAVGDLDGVPGDEIVVGDGWHFDYGKIARCRIAVVSRQGNDWRYDLIEDLEDHLRFEQIDLIDLNADGRPEIVARASTDSVSGGTVRVYQRGPDGWQGMTAGPNAQTYGIGEFNGDKTLELVFAGQPPMPFSLASAGPRWDAKLGEALDTRVVDPSSLVGHLAPALKATEWVGAEPQTLASLKGKVVMLDYWATWCKPCIEMYPEMREWLKELGPQGLVILGITNHSQQTSEVVRRFHARQKLPWAVAIDPKNGTHRDYGVSPIPHTFLIDRQGVVRFEHRGGGDLTAIKAKLKELLAETAADGRQ
jgi:peroxiredoxin